MTSAGVETLLQIARRSLWIVALLVVVNAALMVAIRQSQGPSYRATADVVLSPNDLGSMLAGFSTYVDPDLIDDTEQALANSRNLFDYVAQTQNGELGTADEIDDATSVSKDGTTVSFSVTGSDADDVVETANAVATAYRAWRAQVSSASINLAISGVRARLTRGSLNEGELRRQLDQLNVMKTLAAGNVLLVESADSAVKLRPRPLRDAVLGALLGLFVALVAIAIREAIDTKVRSEEEVEDLLNVPVVGTVETLPRRTRLVTVGRHNHRYGDMYALLAASVAPARVDGKQRVIAVTSATAEEGKTTTASNLAAALAQRDAKVVLVDLDSRRPALAKLFRIPPTAPGVGEAIKNGVEPSRLAWNVRLDGMGVSATPAAATAPAATATIDSEPDSRNGDQPGGSLRVLPIGAIAKDAVVRHPEAIRRLLTWLRVDADYVIIDTPPALSVPDMTQLAGFVDYVLVVVRHGRVTRRSLAAFTRLHRSWPNVGVGAVLVATPHSDDTYGY